MMKICTRAKVLAIAAGMAMLVPINRAADNHEFPDSPRAFLQGALEANRMELRAGQLAQQQGSHPAVRRLGNALVEDNRRIQDQLRRVAQEYNVQTDQQSTVEGKHREQWQRLQNASGREFDRNFLRFVIEDHRRDLQMLEESAEEFQDDQQIRRLIEQNRPTVRRHLEMAEAAARQVEVAMQDRNASNRNDDDWWEHNTHSYPRDREPTYIDNRRQQDITYYDRDDRRETRTRNARRATRDDREVLGLPTSKDDGTILGLFPAPSRTIEAGSRQAYIARELADGEVDPNVDNIFQADREAVGAPGTMQREQRASRYLGAEQRQANQRNQWQDSQRRETYQQQRRDQDRWQNEQRQQQARQQRQQGNIDWQREITWEEAEDDQRRGQSESRFQRQQSERRRDNQQAQRQQQQRQQQQQQQERQRQEQQQQQRQQQQLPQEVRQALNEKGWNAQETQVRRVTVFELRKDGQTVYATRDGQLLETSNN